MDNDEELTIEDLYWLIKPFTEELKLIKPWKAPDNEQEDATS